MNVVNGIVLKDKDGKDLTVMPVSVGASESMLSMAHKVAAVVSGVVSLVAAAVSVVGYFAPAKIASFSDRLKASAPLGALGLGALLAANLVSAGASFGASKAKTAYAAYKAKQEAEGKKKGDTKVEETKVEQK